MIIYDNYHILSHIIMMRNSIVEDIIDYIDALIVNITQLLMLILLFVLFIIINAFIRIHYTYI